MSCGVYIQVTIPVRGHDGVRALAQRSLKEAWRIDGECCEADRFLEDVSNGIGYSWGNDGDLLIWGMVGNWAKPRVFAEVLRPFWMELLSEPHKDYPEPEYKIVIIYQEEGHAAGALQIGFDNPESPDRTLLIDEFPNLPFTWNT